MQIRPYYLVSYRHATSLQFLRSGEAYFQTMIRIIDAAKKEIHLQIYIIEDDRTGQEVALALKRAANRGVSINIVLDSFGCLNLSNSFVDDLASQGIRVRFFSSLFNFFKLKLGRRLHQKVLVVDDRYVLIGGLNIAARYRGDAENPPWLDFGVLAEGEIALEASKLCSNILNKKFAKQRRLRRLHSFSLNLLKASPLVRLRQHDYVRRRNSISQSYKYSMRHAEKTLTLVASYFLPGNLVLRRLRKASERGVKITIVLSEMTDAPFLKRATNYLYRWLLRNNVTIYEYKPAMVHGKIAIADDEWVTIGSFNFNHLSEYGSIELNVDVLDSAWAMGVRKILDEIIRNDCNEVTNDKYIQRRTFMGRIFDATAYYSMHFVFWFIMYMSKRERWFK